MQVRVQHKDGYTNKTLLLVDNWHQSDNSTADLLGRVCGNGSICLDADGVYTMSQDDYDILQRYCVDWSLVTDAMVNASRHLGRAAVDRIAQFAVYGCDDLMAMPQLVINAVEIAIARHNKTRH